MDEKADMKIENMTEILVTLLMRIILGLGL